jgi:hypothetical protein
MRATEQYSDGITFHELAHTKKGSRSAAADAFIRLLAEGIV